MTLDAYCLRAHTDLSPFERRRRLGADVRSGRAGFRRRPSIPIHSKQARLTDWPGQRSTEFIAAIYVQYNTIYTIHIIHVIVHGSGTWREHRNLITVYVL